MEPPSFLSLEEVTRIHAAALHQFGGDEGFLNLGSLESAINVPVNLFNYTLDNDDPEWELSGEDFAEMAAYYWYHITMNHALVDGNKRVGYIAAKVFLLMNGYTFTMPHDLAETLSLRLTAHDLEKHELAEEMRPFVS